jgi:hypothetical protein
MNEIVQEVKRKVKQLLHFVQEDMLLLQGG